MVAHSRSLSHGPGASRRPADPIARALASHPHAREALLPYVARAKAYAGACGCASAGVSFLAALVVAIVRIAWGGLPHGHEVGSLGATAGGVLLAGFIGKLTGLGYARVRLWLLYRAVERRYG